MIDPWHIPEEDLKRLMADRVVLSMSGGKDSTACALLLERYGIEFERIFFDTGWEHPALYKYIEETLEPRFGKVTRLTSKKYPGGMVDMVRQKGVFPSGKMRFCTDELKLKPAKAYFNAFDEPIINVVGVRREESSARSRALRWEDDAGLDVEVYRPLIKHSFDDIITLHRDAGIAPNPLYLRGAERVGCFPCIYARKSEVKKVAELWPGRIDEIEALEAELTAALRSDAEKVEAIRERAIERVCWLRALKPLGVSWKQFKAHKRGKEVLSDDLVLAYASEVDDCKASDKDVQAEVDRMSKRTFFHGRTDDGIRDVVDWSTTIRGGRQYMLFDETARDGCTRWGMCEGPLADTELVKITG